VPGDLRPVALSAEEGWADISVPEGETWLGSSRELTRFSRAELFAFLERTEYRIHPLPGGFCLST
jgi:hypothetical protein